MIWKGINLLLIILRIVQNNTNYLRILMDIWIFNKGIIKIALAKVIRGIVINLIIKLEI